MLAVLLLVLGPIGVVGGLAVTAGVMAVRQRSKEPLFALCLLATVLTLGSFGMYLSYLVEPTVEVEVMLEAQVAVIEKAYSAFRG